VHHYPVMHDATEQRIKRTKYYRYLCLCVLFYRSLLILYFIYILMCSYCCLFGILNLIHWLVQQSRHWPAACDQAHSFDIGRDSFLPRCRDDLWTQPCSLDSPSHCYNIFTIKCHLFVYYDNPPAGSVDSASNA